MAHLPSDIRELSVGQLSARSGVAVSALHFYEAQGLITSRRTTGNQRRYPRDVLRRVDQLVDNRTPTRPDWARLSAAWRDDLDDRIAQLQRLRDRLTGCIGCGCLSLDRCQLANPDDVLGGDGPGARNLPG